MNTRGLARLLLVSRIRQEGASQFLLRVAPLSLLNILLLFAIFTTADGHALDLTTLTLQYGYFIPLTALSAAVGTWEVELMAGVAEEFLLRPSRGLRARLLTSPVEALPPFALFTVLLLLAPLPLAQRLAHLATATGMLVVFLLLGTALGYCFGFRHEKSVNNFLASLTWVLGFGPGPFFGARADGPARLFPGGYSMDGDFGAEWIKLAAFTLLAVGLLYWGSRPRRQRAFTR
ncbi:hypothetical protein ACIHAA_01910 [Streptomyces sp. NPDC052040]|uniref:hypothetical protein n=1 Tax=unclassified Streptomyces TaxID=2593676 RepID=UPI0037CD1192